MAGVDLAHGAENAGRGLAGDHRPRPERHALGVVARCDVRLAGGIGGRAGLVLARLVERGDVERRPARGLIACELVELVAVVDRVVDHPVHVVERRIAHRLKLKRRDRERVLDAVLDAHRHERVEAQLDEREFARQVRGVVAHRVRDDRGEALGGGLARIRVPLRRHVDDTVVGEDVRAVIARGFGAGEACGTGDPRSGGTCARRHLAALARALTDGTRDRGLGEQLEPGRTVRVHLEARAARMRGQGRGDDAGRRQHAGPVDRGDVRPGRDDGRGQPDERVHARNDVRLHLPGVAPVGKRDVCTRHRSLARSAADGDLRPQALALEAGPRDRGVPALGGNRGGGSTGSRAEDHVDNGAHVDGVPVDVVRGERGEERVDLGFLALEGVHQRGLGEAGIEHGRQDAHPGHRVRVELGERRVSRLDGGAHGLGEPHRVPHALDPVIGRVDGLVAGRVEGLLVDRGEQADLERARVEARELCGEIAEEHVGVRGVAGAANLQLTGELALFLDPRDEFGDGLGASADRGVGRRRVDGGLDRGELGVLVDDLRNVLRRVFDERHRAGVLVGHG